MKNLGYNANNCYNLTPTQIVVLHEIANGMSDKEIASKLNKSIHTVSTHAKTILERLGCNCRVIAVRMFLEFSATYDPELLLNQNMYDVYEAHKTKNFVGIALNRNEIEKYTHKLKAMRMI